MRAWQLGPRPAAPREAGEAIDFLTLTERHDPAAGPGELVVRVTAAGLNYRDLMVLRGVYGRDLPEHRIPLTDGVGVIEQVGEGVTGFAVGERVIAANFTDWLGDGGYGYHVFASDLGVTRDGWLAERIVLPAAAAIRVPDAVSDDTAAATAVVAGTVWHAMVAFGQVQPGDLVLTQGTGGVALYSLQLAKALGATVAITSSSEAKLARVRDMGADYTVNYRERPDWAAALLEATGGRGADVVVDTIGFAQFGQTLAATGVEGRIGTLGALSGSPQDRPDFDQGALIGKNVTVKGIASGHRGMIEAALGVMAEHGIAMVIDRSFAFEEAPAAYRHLLSGAHLGKVLVRVSG
ncbi:zinc-dependent alcohol dehydrogenase family protein [Erythrobacter sp. WG]|uniref:zinc-dependent alcohol dehydrogenase family protein n=1 Tax=Erythrobacter sp. WG TaxID=2985510 RepID=UPI00226FFE83|nr:NAD(P)-dependent alcohol dehydrogenase [Erythrobacter sp. WG]MCX9146424.1 NAD(P)-dependent alcohol dehydrogenase [Erythrobacter sp. WG]